MSKLDKVNVKSSKAAKTASVSAGAKLQGRDTIYIDTEDDITSIIEKVKKSKNTVIALVPPKRIGALQSVVNLKLLQKAAGSNRKKIALVTTDPTLIALAATLSVPVARSLNSQPELMENPEIITDEEDFIDGNDIAIGDLAKTGNQSGRRGVEDKEITAAVAAIETDDKIKNDLDADGEPDDKPKPAKKNKKRAIPNFDSFRKKLFIFGGLGVLLIAFLVWAIWFAPSGTIIINAKTASKDLSASISLQPSTATDIEKNIIQPVVKQIKKTETVNFQATGSKETGERATGNVVVYNTYSLDSFTLPAGTVVAYGNLQFTLSAAVAVPGMSGNIDSPKPGVSKQISVTATNIGEDYNIGSNNNLSISGQSAKVYAVTKNEFSGGSKQTVKVVEQSDLDTATDKLKDQVDRNQLQSDLTKEMGDGVTVISESFAASYGEVASKPAVSEVASNGSASATLEITYTLVGITDKDLKSFIENQVKSVTEDEQKIYDNGLDKVQFKNFAASGANYNVTLKTTVYVGPNLDEGDIKKRVLGKRSGEISESLESIPGVNSVEVRFSPFWVNSISDENKLKIEFAVNE